MADGTVTREITTVTLGNTGIVSVVGTQRVSVEGMEFERTFGESYAPGDDVSALPEKVRGICATWWDDDIVQVHAELTEAAVADAEAMGEDRP